jgi:CRP/FNR family transcriptional regulator
VASTPQPWWLLKPVRFLSALDAEELGALASSLAIHRYRKGQTVFDQTESVADVSILLSGLVKISRVDPESGKELILYMVGPGEPFGVIPFFDEKPANRLATALKASRVATIDRHTFAPLLERRAVEDAVLHMVAARGRRMEDRLYDLAFHDVSRRLAQLLLQLSEQFPKERECGSQIAIWLSQQDLANFVAATRETVSLTINDFKRRGWIATHGRRICIHDAKALDEFIP